MKIPSIVMFGRRKEIFDKIKYLVDNKVIIHNDQLDIDYVVLHVEITEELGKGYFDCAVKIDILNKDEVEVLNNLYEVSQYIRDNMMTSGLLPTKPPEKFAGEE